MSSSVTANPPTPIRASVILCTHNPRLDYLRRAIAGLRAQTLAPDCWELIVVDNRSDQPVAALADFTWHPSARVVREETLGLTPARLRGIGEARGELLVFVDDDNVLAPGYLETALRIADEKRFLGSWSGQCRPVFEQPPAEWTRRYWGNLVIREFDADVWSNLPRLDLSMPCGAGLCVRREVALHYDRLHHSGRRTFQFDRTGDSLVSGGDNDLAASACALGLGVGLMTSLELEHLVPPERLTVDYLARLAEGIQFSGVLLDHEHGLVARPRGFIGRVADILRLLRLSKPDRTVLRAAYRGRERALRHLAARKDT